jgi:type VI secretion system protein VasJ
MDIHLLEGVGRAPIPGFHPANADMRDTPDFEALQAEIAKLTTPGAGAIDWARVSQLGGKLLAENGKDLLVASYVGAAATQQAGLPGLAVGLEILADLVEHHWEDLTPPLTRLRGRRNAIQWLLDRLDLVAQDARWDDEPPLPAELADGLLAHLDRLDTQLRERDEESPSMRPLRQWLDRLPVAAPPPDATRSNPPAPEVAESMAPGPAPERAPAQRPASSPRPALPPLPGAAEDDLESVWEHALDHLGQLADRLLAADPCDARAYRASRLAHWGNLQALPPASDGRTQIPAPITQVVGTWGRLCLPDSEAGDALAFAEAQLPAFPLWLDLQFLSGRALARLEQDAARREVEAATRDLLARLPELASLSFASGMPFAASETLEWLAGLQQTGPNRPEDDGASSRHASRTHEAKTSQARALAANGELEAALALLQRAITETRDPAVALQLRIQLCALLKAHHPGRVPSAFADEILAQLRRHDLAHWAPALALDGLAVAFSILREDETRAADADGALQVLARLDALRALQAVAAN